MTPNTALADRRVLIPYDFSPQARAAAFEADALVAGAGGTLTLLYVQHVTAVHGFDFAYVEPPEKTMAVREAAEETLERLVGELSTPRARVTIEVAVGDTVDVILAHAREHELVVMGTHGRKGVQRFLLGSVAERVIRASPCSVWVVKGS